MIVYFNGDHSHLRRQVRQGIARTLVENILFGDDLGEFAANQALLDLPQWLVDGYIDYVAEDWSTELDDQLKSALLSGNTKTFTSLLLRSHYWPVMLSGIISLKNTKKRTLLIFFTSHEFTVT